MFSSSANSPEVSHTGGTPENRSAVPGGGSHLSTLSEVPLDAVAAREYAAYQTANPYKHIIIDGLIPDAIARDAMREIQAYRAWTTRRTPQGRKGGLGGESDMRIVDQRVAELVDFFQSDRFVRFLGDLTGIQNLTKDTALWGAGPFSIGTDGYLSLHTDFNRHRTTGGRLVTPWRRINVLLYLNQDWRDEYGGAFELWETDQKYSFLDYRVKVVPQFNRLAIFSVTDVSIHGHLDLVNHPRGEARKTISMYYYTQHVDDEPLITQKLHESIYMPGFYKTRSNDRHNTVVPKYIVR